MRASSQQLYAKVVECAKIADECGAALIKAFDANIRAQNDYINAVLKYKKEAEAEQAQWADSLAKIEQAHEQRDADVVTMDVGGVLFKTRVETLSKHPLSYFGVYTSGRWNLSETAFIDRDPELFRYIMAYLRHDTLQLCDIGPELRVALAAEAEYYVLPELKALMAAAQPQLKEKSKTTINDWHISMTGRDAGDDVHKLTHRNPLSKFQCAVGSKGWSSGVHEWSVTGSRQGASNIVGVFFMPTITFAFSNMDRLHNTSYVFGIHTDAANGTSPNNKGNLPAVFGPNFTTRESNIFGIRLDLDKKIITFGLNGVWNNLPTYAIDPYAKPGVLWYPYFDIWDAGTSMWLVK